MEIKQSITFSDNYYGITVVLMVIISHLHQSTNESPNLPWYLFNGMRFKQYLYICLIFICIYALEKYCNNYMALCHIKQIVINVWT